MKPPHFYIRKSIQLFFLAVLCFCMGDSAARMADKNPLQISSWNADTIRQEQAAGTKGSHADVSQTVPASAEGNWGLSFQQEGKPPVGNATADYLKQFQAFYVNQTDEKVIYLTFDAGYENGNTAPILDALKKHHAPAAFFLVGNYLETSPEQIGRAHV